ncbi:MAG: hypothetical protein R2771_14625, partial [Saprospiraceae bacterium]
MIDFYCSVPLLNIEWDNGENTEDIVVRDSGIYVVEFIGVNNCINYDSIRVNKFTDLPQDIKVQDTVYIGCNGPNVKLIPEVNEPISSFTWFGGVNNDTFHIEQPTVSHAGDYYLSVTNIYGCSNTFGPTKVIEDFNAPEINFIDPIPEFKCGDESLQLSFTSDMVIQSVIWTGPGGFESNDISPYIYYGGVYNVTVIGENNCIGNASVNVVYNVDVPDVSITTDTIDCDDKTLDISVSYTGNYSVSWIDPIGNNYSGNSIVTTIPGFYNLEVFDIDNNCKSNFLVYAPQDVRPLDLQIKADTNVIDCNFEELVLTYNSAVDLSSVHWYGDNFSSYGDTIVIDNAGIYYVEAIGVNNCTDLDSIVIFEGQKLELQNDTFYLTCQQTNINLDLNLTGGGYIYNWSGPNGFNSTLATPNVSQEGIYIVNVSNGECSATAEMKVVMDTISPEINIV